jgi:LAO/AO transport system kinase
MSQTSDPQALIDQARSGDRRALARLISIVENGRPGQEEVLSTLYPAAGQADRLIEVLRGRESDVAVLAVDPSSPFTGGAILGDRVRMQGHIDDAGVYIRSMASRGHLGGIAEATPRAIVVLDGMGFPEILVETVGVGQAEVEVAAAADTTIVVLNPGWGDSVQAAKAGLLEIGDVFVVNKADRPGVNDTVRDLKQMLELGGHGGWWPPVVTTVATTAEGIEKLAGAVDEHRAYLESTGERSELRRRHTLGLLDDAVDAELRRRLEHVRDDEAWDRIRGQVEERILDPWTAAVRLVGGESSPQ